VGGSVITWLIISQREIEIAGQAGCGLVLSSAPKPRLDEVLKQVWGKDSKNFRLPVGP